MTERWLQRAHPSWRYECPQLSSYPSIAKQSLIDFYQKSEDLPYIIGSSLGGFWASWCVERFGGKAVLVNPAVAPHTRFQHFLNQPLKSYYSDDVYKLTERDLTILKACDTASHQDPSAYHVMLQTGDETLDYTMALERYQASSISLEEGGNHSFEGFENHFEQIFRFFTGQSE